MTDNTTVNALKRIQNLANFTEDEKVQLLVLGSDGSLDALVMSFEGNSPLLTMALRRKLAPEENRSTSIPALPLKETGLQNPKLMSPPMKLEKSAPLPTPVPFPSQIQVPASQPPTPSQAPKLPQPAPAEAQPKKAYIQMTKHTNAVSQAPPTSPNGLRSPGAAIQYPEVDMDPAILAELEKFEQMHAMPEPPKLPLPDQQPGLSPTSGLPTGVDLQAYADDVPYSVELTHVLSLLGIARLQPFQEETLGCLLTGDDIIVVSGTSSGKSLCYQLPPLCTKKVGIVISPLISLMQDQVNNLKTRGVKAVFLGQGGAALSGEEVLATGISLIYLAPERLSSFLPEISKIYEAKQLAMFGIDEAHLIQLSLFRKHCPDVPAVAVTATATGETVQTIATSLALRSPTVIYTTLYRDNLALSFRPRKDWSDVLLLQHYPSGIVYVNTRKTTLEIAAYLRDNGLPCEAYHGGLPIAQRKSVLDRFVARQLNYVVATIAFGMGINRPDVRCILHYGGVKSIECYYQQCGRAGRDGLPADCIMFAQISDFRVLGFNSTAEERLRLPDMINLAFNPSTCRMRQILEYFDEELVEPCRKCDNCLKPVPTADFTREAIFFLESLKEAESRLPLRFGQDALISCLRGSLAERIKLRGFQALSCFNQGKHHSAPFWKALGQQLRFNGFIREVLGLQYASHVTLTHKGLEYVRTQQRIELPLVEPLRHEQRNLYPTSHPVTHASPVVVKPAPRTPRNVQNLMATFLNVRQQAATDLGVEPGQICTEKLLYHIADVRPSSLHALTRLFLEASAMPLPNYAYQAFFGALQQEKQREKSEEQRLAQEQQTVPALPLSGVEALGPQLRPVYEMFQRECAPIELICQTRGHSINTVLSILSRVVEAGLPVDLSRADLDEVSLQAMQEAYNAVGRTMANWKNMQEIFSSRVPSLTWITRGHLELGLAVEFNLAHPLNSDQWLGPPDPWGVPRKLPSTAEQSAKRIKLEDLEERQNSPAGFWDLNLSPGSQKGASPHRPQANAPAQVPSKAELPKHPLLKPPNPAPNPNPNPNPHPQASQSYQHRPAPYQPSYASPPSASQPAFAPRPYQNQAFAPQQTPTRLEHTPVHRPSASQPLPATHPDSAATERDSLEQLLLLGQPKPRSTNGNPSNASSQPEPCWAARPPKPQYNRPLQPLAPQQASQAHQSSPDRPTPPPAGQPPPRDSQGFSAPD